MQLRQAFCYPENLIIFSNYQFSIQRIRLTSLIIIFHRCTPDIYYSIHAWQSWKKFENICIRKSVLTKKLSKVIDFQQKFKNIKRGIFSFLLIKKAKSRMYFNMFLSHTKSYFLGQPLLALLLLSTKGITNY